MKASYRVRGQIWHQRWSGFRLVVLGAIAALIAFHLRNALSGHPHIEIVVAAVIIGATLIGMRKISKSMSRSHGVRVESKYGKQLENILVRKGFEVQRNMVPQGSHVGDIDLLVRWGAAPRGALMSMVFGSSSNSGGACIIEIKAYRTWTGHSDRETSAIHQVAAQMRASGASLALIWLPEGSRKFVALAGTESAVNVVSGEALDVAGILERFRRRQQ